MTGLLLFLSLIPIIRVPSVYALVREICISGWRGLSSPLTQFAFARRYHLSPLAASPSIKETMVAAVFIGTLVNSQRYRTRVTVRICRHVRGLLAIFHERGTSFLRWLKMSVKSSYYYMCYQAFLFLFCLPTCNIAPDEKIRNLYSLKRSRRSKLKTVLLIFSEPINNTTRNFFGWNNNF